MREALRPSGSGWSTSTLLSRENGTRLLGNQKAIELLYDDVSMGWSLGLRIVVRFAGRVVRTEAMDEPCFGKRSTCLGLDLVPGSWIGAWMDLQSCILGTFQFRCLLFGPKPHGSHRLPRKERGIETK